MTDWVKTIYEIQGDKSTLDILEKELYTEYQGEERFIYHRVIHIPDALLLDISQYAFEVAVLLEKLEEDKTDFKVFTLERIKDYIDFISQTKLENFSDRYTDDLVQKGIPIDTLLVDYLREHYREETSVSIKLIKNNRELGYYSLPGFCMDQLGCLSLLTFFNEKKREDTRLSGSFVCEYMAPGTFFSTLQEIYPVRVKVTARFPNEDIVIVDDLMTD